MSARGYGLKRQKATVFYLRALEDLDTVRGPDGVLEEYLRFKNEKNGIVLGFGDFSPESQRN